MKAPEPRPHPPAPSHPDRAVCEVCGREAEFQFLDKIDGPTAKRWRKFCPTHAREFLDMMPDSGSGILE